MYLKNSKTKKKNACAVLMFGSIALYCLLWIFEMFYLDEACRNSKPTVNQLTVTEKVAVEKNQTRTTLSMQEQLREIRNAVANINKQQVVWHKNVFGPFAPGDPIVLIQVHNRWHYLEVLLDSLRKVIGIEKALLIFSHDFYNHSLRDVPQKANFSKVMQIFYPHAAQLYPDEFPGQHPNDCSRDMTKKLALKAKCNNAAHPDTYGHYREAKFAQIKNHWWWKLKRVYEELEVTRDHDGPLLLLEEDYFVFPDLFHVMGLLMDLNISNHSSASIRFLGNMINFQRYAKPAEVEVRKWGLSTNNMGIIFTPSLWHTIKSCAAIFCTYDDYNWDLTLNHLGKKCVPHGLHFFLKGSRIYHIGDCGIHTKTSQCKGQKLMKAKNMLKGAQRELFPTSLVVQMKLTAKNRIPSVSGGWSDPRDHHLCLSILNGTT